MASNVIAPWMFRRAGFSQNSVAGLVFWLDGSQTSGYADGAPMPNWTQPLGNVSQPTGAKQPAYMKSSINGQAAVNCAGAQWFSGTAIPIAGPFTLFFAGTPTSTAVPRFMLECGQVSTNNTNYYFYVNNTNRVEGGFHDGTNFQGLMGQTAPSGQPMVARLRYTGALIDVWRNGISSGAPVAAATTPTTAGSQALFVGSQRTTTGTNMYQGLLGSLLIYNRSLNDTEARYVEQSLGSRWGVVIP